MLQYLMNYLSARQDEEGQGLVEYALIITLVALAVIIALTAVGTSVAGQFDAIVAKL